MSRFTDCPGEIEKIRATSIFRLVREVVERGSHKSDVPICFIGRTLIHRLICSFLPKTYLTSRARRSAGFFCQVLSETADT